jgi:hypothetical protein
MGWKEGGRRDGPGWAPNLDHIDNTKPGTRSKEGNNVFWVWKGKADYKDKKDPMVWPMGSGFIVRGGTWRTKRARHEGGE